MVVKRTSMGKTARKIGTAFVLILLLLLLAEFFIELHPHFGLDSAPLFHAWYGFGACALMIIFAKFIALFLKRPDDYYKEDK